MRSRTAVQAALRLCKIDLRKSRPPQKNICDAFSVSGDPPVFNVKVSGTFPLSTPPPLQAPAVWRILLSPPPAFSVQHPGATWSSWPTGPAPTWLRSWAQHWTWTHCRQVTTCGTPQLPLYQPPPTPVWKLILGLLAERAPTRHTAWPVVSLGGPWLFLAPHTKAYFGPPLSSKVQHIGSM